MTEAFIVIVIIVVILAAAKYIYQDYKKDRKQKLSPQYKYSRKKEFITKSEKEFYKLLVEVAGDRYYIFPQIHLSALFKNETYGRYHKLAFQIINRRSVDYILCDKTSLEPVYAVELDDSTHDTPDRIKRDENVNKLFELAGFPLVRFRDYKSLTKEDIAKKFFDAHNSLKF
ncbi:MAG: DUF2726 domain-containing protein [Candidatus Microsaccharimonas sp.]